MKEIIYFLAKPENDRVLLFILLGLSILTAVIICFVAKKNAKKELKGLKDIKK
jgi:uncharacterized protein YneF (UPF0154 family)